MIRRDFLLKTTLKWWKSSLAVLVASGISTIIISILFYNRLLYDLRYSPADLIFDLIPVCISGVFTIGTYYLFRKYNQQLIMLRREDSTYAIGVGKYADLGTESRIRVFASQIEKITGGDPGGGGVSESSAGGGSLNSDGPAAIVQNTLSPVPARKLSKERGVYTEVVAPTYSEETGSISGRPVDVFISYPLSGIARDWVTIELVPLFSKWLSEKLGRDATVWYDRKMEGGTDWQSEIDKKIAKAQTAILIISRRTVVSDHLKQEMERLLERLPADHVFPIQVDNVKPMDIPAIGSLQWWDFSDTVYVGESFGKSERYIEFQDRVRELASNVAEAIESRQTDNASTSSEASPNPSI